MKNILAALLAALMTAVSCGTQPPATEPDSEPVGGEIVQMTETFADKLNAQMPQDKNYMFSPLSVKMALALAANGAEGETRDEILAACDIDDLGEFNQYSREMIDRYSQADILSLDIANSIWLNTDNTDSKFAQSYKDTLTKYYDAEAAEVNNKNAVSTVNKWVNDKTREKIPGIISDSDFAAALVNAVYFKAHWQDEFSEYATEKEDFTEADGKIAQVDMMRRTDYMNYYSDGQTQIAELPYRNYETRVDEKGYLNGRTSYDDIDVSMYVILGDDKNPEELLNKAEFSSAYVALSMPKFKTEFDITLNDALKALGINRAFDKNSAQFRPMFTGGDFMIDEVLHKTYINVDEEGTEAAAVTAVMMAGTGIRNLPEPVELKLDRPFTYVIRDNISGEILFMGRFAYAK